MKPEWTDALRVVTGLVCLLLFILGVRWQARTFRGDVETDQRRMKSAVALCVACIVGVSVWAGFSLGDPRSKLTFSEAAWYVVGIAALSAGFIVKTWLGPLLISASVSWAAYMFFEYGELRLLPIFEMLVRGFMEQAPVGVAHLYAVVTLLHAALGSVYASLRASEVVTAPA